MNDEQHVRTLLRRAAELPDLGPAPVGRLIAAGRRRRSRNRVMAAATAAIAVTAAVTIPIVIGGASRVRPPAGGPAVSQDATGAALAHGHWSQLPTSSLRGVMGDFLAAWTGKELLVVNESSLEGAAYVPGARWHQIAAIPDGLGTDNRGVFWTGDGLVVLYRRPAAAPGGPQSVAAIYNPATNTWSVVSFPQATFPGGEPELFAVAPLGDQIVFAAIVSGRPEAYSYNVASRSWRRLALSLPARHKVAQLTMLSADDRLVLWSTWNNGPDDKLATAGTSGVDVRAMAPGGTWTAVAGWPQDLQYFTFDGPVGGQVLLTFEVPPQSLPHGVAYLMNAGTLALRALPDGPAAPSEPGFGHLVFTPGLWTGSAVLWFSPDYTLNAGPAIFDENMAALDPASGRWYRLRSGPPSPIVWPLPPVWTGTQMLVTDGTALWSFGK